MSKNKIVNINLLLNELAQIRGKTVGLITGCFDVLHLGHLGIFQFAKKHVDILVVGIDSDEAVKATKGPTRPINTQKHRCQLVAELISVDYVLPLTFKKTLMH